MVDREIDQHRESGGALHQRADRRLVVPAHQEVPFPVPGNGSVGDLRRPFGDHHHVGDHPPSVAGPCPRQSLGASCAQAARELLAKLPPTLHEQALVDRLVRDPHAHIVGEILPQATRDLLRGPLAAEVVDHAVAQPTMAQELDRFGSSRQ
jgi:hypothetical protein